MTWLLPCLIGTMFTGLIMFAFDGPLEKSNWALLVLFVPMIAAMGGNSGVQASTIIIRGMATQEMAGQSLALAFRREAPIALAVGLGCGVTAGLVAIAVTWFRTAAGVHAPLGPVAVGFAVSLAMALAIMVAVGLGTLLPFLFRKIGIDPAIASGPLITTTNDIISVAIFLTIALLTAGFSSP
jgi:magnesium transporter